MAENIDIQGLVAQRKELEAMMMSNPDMEKRVQALIRKVLLAARRAISNQSKGSMKSDPRQAYKAVKSSVYRRILGGSVSILNRKKAGKWFLYAPPRKSHQGQRGGNRIKRPAGGRTEQVMSYDGADRGFILRFINSGTGGRSTKYGNRGSISPRNFFRPASTQAMNRAADDLTKLIDDLIKKEFK